MCLQRLSNLFGSSRRARLGFGLCVLLVVDVIWVASAELTKYIFSHQDFNKPFFSVYLKTAIFSSYLLGFLCHPPWRDQCGPLRSLCRALRSCHQPNSGNEPDRSADESASRALAVTVSNDITEEDGSISSSLTLPASNAMSEPIYEKMTDDDGSSLLSSEETESADGEKHVRFRKTKEIRRLRATSDASGRPLETIHENSNRMSLKETAKLALLFSFPWLAANLFYQEALSFTSAAVTNILSSTSGLFTLILAAIFKSSSLDRLTLSKLLAVAVSLSGIIVITWSDPTVEKNTVDQGALYALAGAFFYAVYLILLKRRAGDEDRLDIPLFFGFVGLFGALLFWPGFIILHFSNIERLELPRDSTTWLFLIGNGVVGTALSELLWVWGCFLTSSLIGTLSLSLVMPLTMMFDMFVNKVHFSPLFLVGTVPVFLSFFAVALFANYEDWDPAMDVLLKLWHVALVKTKCRQNEDERENLMANETTSSQEDNETQNHNNT